LLPYLSQQFHPFYIFLILMCDMCINGFERVYEGIGEGLFVKCSTQTEKKEGIVRTTKDIRMNRTGRGEGERERERKEEGEA